MQHFYRNVSGWFNYTRTFDILLDSIPDENFRFAEIGSWMGRSISYFTVEVINRNKTGEIYAIDTFAGSEEHLDPSNPSFNPNLFENPEYLYEQYKMYTECISSYITTIRNTSVEASKKFDDNSLDAIYLDAAHDYDSVTADLKAWYPKLKQDKTLLFADDWDYPTVRKAASDFAKEHKLKIKLTEPNEYLITNI